MANSSGPHAAPPSQPPPTRAHLKPPFLYAPKLSHLPACLWVSAKCSLCFFLLIPTPWGCSMEWPLKLSLLHQRSAMEVSVCLSFWGKSCMKPTYQLCARPGAPAKLPRCTSEPRPPTCCWIATGPQEVQDCFTRWLGQSLLPTRQLLFFQMTRDWFSFHSSVNTSLWNS